jgi:hypothetical protein
MGFRSNHELMAYFFVPFSPPISIISNRGLSLLEAKLSPRPYQAAANMGIERDPVTPNVTGRLRDYRPEQLGQEFDLGCDPRGYQRKDKVAAVAKCPTCHKEVALVAETEEWERRANATWEHAGWGSATGVCCDNLIVELSNGYEVFPLPTRRIDRN